MEGAGFSTNGNNWRGYYAYNGGTYRLQIGGDSSAGSLLYNVTLSTSTWYHICWTYDGTNTASSGILYLNGTQVATANLFGVTDNTAFTTTLVFGSERNGSASWAQMKMDEILLLRRVASPTEVTSLYNGGLGFAWPFIGNSAIFTKNILGMKQAVNRASTY